ncbi:MAG: lysophospholipid acyltransferase family protein [Gammaproteobacteria bacterium]|nr:lysophospholipid acyltransferase family protein [Gammaproteobacteria bacterium]
MAAVIKLILRMLALMPLPVIHAAGYLLGTLFFLVPNRRRSTTIVNIKLCFPELGGWDHWQLVRRSLVETTKGALESSAMWMRGSKRVLKLVKGVVNEQLLVDAYARGKGVILAAPHLGMWEIIGLHMSARYPMTCLYLPPPIAGLDKTMIQGRTRLGGRVVRTDARGVRTLFKRISNGELTAILPDQDPSRGQGKFAPFFGIQANTMVLLSRLANKTGAVVLCAWAERLSFGRGYIIHLKETDKLVTDSNVSASLASLNYHVEQCIRQKPEQYLWCYKRFRTRPEGEAKLYTH